MEGGKTRGTESLIRTELSGEHPASGGAVPVSVVEVAVVKVGVHSWQVLPSLSSPQVHVLSSRSRRALSMVSVNV